MENKKLTPHKLITSQQDLENLVKGDRVSVGSRHAGNDPSVYEFKIERKVSFITYDNKYNRMYQDLINISDLTFNVERCGEMWSNYSSGEDRGFERVWKGSPGYDERLKLLQQAGLYHG